LSDRFSKRASEFSQALSLPDQQLDLVRDALAISSAFNPGLDPETYLHELDLMVDAVSQRSAAIRGRITGSDRVLNALVRYLFQELGFRGNNADYYDPRNSYLNEVLDRRRGIPITLSVLFIELGRRNGLTLDGVGYPGHFLVRWTNDEGNHVFLDAFNEGKAVAEETLLDELGVGSVAAERARSLLAGVTKRQILTRMLHNLKAAFSSREDFSQALLASELILAISPWDLDERRDHGLLAHAAGERELAIEDLETYLSYRSEAKDARRVERQLELIRNLTT
jgi:regulator of sirC expression with transglutaminase-like and TPR domain